MQVESRPKMIGCGLQCDITRSIVLCSYCHYIVHCSLQLLSLSCPLFFAVIVIILSIVLYRYCDFLVRCSLQVLSLSEPVRKHNVRTEHVGWGEATLRERVGRYTVCGEKAMHASGLPGTHALHRSGQTYHLCNQLRSMRHKCR